MSEPQRRTRGPHKPRNLFGGYVRSYCLIFHLNQKQLASLAGISQSTLTRATSGRRHPTRRTIQKVWTALERQAQRQGGVHLLLVTEELERGFFHAADRATAAEVEASRLGAARLQTIAGTGTKNAPGLRS